MIRRVLTHTGNWVSHTAVWPARVSRELLVKTRFSAKGKESWVFGSQTPKGRTLERERLGNILGAILEDFFAIGARESSLEMEIEDLDQISAVSLFSME
ncbi:unnamed protein product [Linum trigynum]|uniref:Uncharacterized protein n=1 Tax=Linum trigynum TaxID=586398 RepID=A0AAV2EZF6_9ROSI